MKIFVFLSVFPLLCLSQQTALFETTLYFEDAVGNRDSIVMGYDTSANNNFNPEFGEMYIREPWDSTFEVRASHYTDWRFSNGDLLLSKKIINPSIAPRDSMDLCPGFVCSTIFFVSLKNPPLTVDWDSDSFMTGQCYRGTTLTPHNLPHIAPGHWGGGPDNEFACMRNVNKAVFTNFRLDDGFRFFLIDDIENNTRDTLVAILWNYLGSFNLCNGIVGVEDNIDTDDLVTIYPNPTTHNVQFDNDGVKKWVLLSKDGQLIQQGLGSEIQMSHLDTGLYYASFFDRDNNVMHTEKILKIR